MKHDAQRLDQIAALHAPTPVGALNAQGVQAKAWELLRWMVAGGVSSERLGGALALYVALFTLDVDEVAHDLGLPPEDDWV